MSNCIVIVSDTGSGKTTLAKALEEKGYRRIVTYTTRPMREGEVDGVDYHFLTKKEFKKRFSEDFFAEVTLYNAEFGHCMYGSAKEDYVKDDKQVIVLNPQGVLEIPAGVIVYLDLSNNVLLKRCGERGDMYEEVKRRMKDDDKYFKYMLEHKPPHIHIKRQASVEQLTNRVLKYMGDL